MIVIVAEVLGVWIAVDVLIVVCLVALSELARARRRRAVR